MNSWSFTGNLGNPAEQRYTAGGDSVVSFSVAVKSGFGEKSTTTWARCVLWGKRGEALMPYLTRGQLVGVVGDVTLREYTDKEGQKRTSLDVRVNNDLTLLGKRDDPPRQAPAERAEPAKPSGSGFDDFEDDIPY